MLKLVFANLSLIFLLTVTCIALFIQPIVAVPSFLCADAFQKVLPFCTGFAAGCMIWMVIAEVLPDAFKVISHLISLLLFHISEVRSSEGKLLLSAYA